MPYVQKLGLEYKFPAYTGLEPEKIEDGGDIAVLRGTDVKVTITATMKTKGGRIALNDKDTVPLTVEADGTLTASFKADKDGSYHVELDAPNGERVRGVAAATRSTCSTDRAPTVTFARPGRDTSASAIEEVYVEAAADDDYGVRDLELVYSVNGGAEKTVPLFNGSKRLPAVSAGHTFYLEELGVKSGDSVSYYARATDNDGVDGGQKASSDLLLRARASASIRSSVRRSRRAAVAAVAAADRTRSTRCPSSSARSSRRRSTCSATSARCRPTSSARTPPSSASRSRSCASRSRDSSRA